MRFLSLIALSLSLLLFSDAFAGSLICSKVARKTAAELSGSDAALFLTEDGMLPSFYPSQFIFKIAEMSEKILSPRDLEIFDKKFGIKRFQNPDGKLEFAQISRSEKITLEEIGKSFGLTGEGVRKVIEKSIERMRPALLAEPTKAKQKRKIKLPSDFYFLPYSFRTTEENFRNLLTFDTALSEKIAPYLNEQQVRLFKRRFDPNDPASLDVLAAEFKIHRLDVASNLLEIFKKVDVIKRVEELKKVTAERKLKSDYDLYFNLPWVEKILLKNIKLFNSDERRDLSNSSRHLHLGLASPKAFMLLKRAAESEASEFLWAESRQNGEIEVFKEHILKNKNLMPLLNRESEGERFTYQEWQALGVMLNRIPLHYLEPKSKPYLRGENVKPYTRKNLAKRLDLDRFELYFTIHSALKKAKALTAEFHLIENRVSP
ncbi:MAG: hypothetical protein J0L93_09265 [Deltaproteobacteria bacterium]|nr:hypothetical protein [Deltaproteobacteria bacterium]